MTADVSPPSESLVTPEGLTWGGSKNLSLEDNIVTFSSSSAAAAPGKQSIPSV